MLVNRIEEKIDNLKREGKKAFITYMTAGLPDYNTTKNIIRTSMEAGLDCMEIGIPFSDPVADGNVIQDASFRAINNGATLEKTFVMMKEIRDETIELPIIFMMYYNQIYNYGIEKFVKRCIECGVDGLIIPDLPFEEQDELRTELNGHEGAPILIQLVSPVSKSRIEKIVKGARGFIYAVSQMGVTGNENSFHNEIKNYLCEVKEKTDIPVMLGFGIGNAKDVEFIKSQIDGAIVGSHFIRLMEDSNFDMNTCADYIKEFKNEL